MKKTVLVLLLGIGFAACNKEPAPLTRQQIRQKVDSITAYRIRELDQQATEDLSHRIKIEVKAKVDSILNSARLQEAAKDSILKKTKTAK